MSHTEANERHLRTPTEAFNLMAIALAGRAAEIQEFGEASSGIASDLQVATTIAAQLVGQLGAGDSLISLEAAAMPTAANLVAKVLADEASRQKVDQMLFDAADAAACLVLEHRYALINLTNALLDYDELTGAEVKAIVVEAVRATTA